MADITERRFLSDDADQDWGRYELVVHDGRAGNGDWYISVLPAGHKVGPTVRICTSGGAAASHPALPAAAHQLYKALNRRTKAPEVLTLSLDTVRRIAPQVAVAALAHRIEEMLPNAGPEYVQQAQVQSIAQVFGDATANAWKLLQQQEGRWVPWSPL